MFVEDNIGFFLYINGKIKIFLDIIVFNLFNSVDFDIYLYIMDVNIGKWVDKGLMSFNIINGLNCK